MTKFTAQLGKPIRYAESHGDLWTATWAYDDAIYCASDDTHGFNNACNSNLAVNRITGDMPPDIHGETINPMSEYGRLGETRHEDGGMWKACGLTCIDGVLYMSVSRHIGAGLDTDPLGIQEAWDSTIIKSYDYGQTWSKMPEYDKAMFPGQNFATPFFVQHGKDGKGTADGADVYVYAVSSKGVWNNGIGMTMGRVRRDKIGQLNSADWEFINGWDKERNPIWHPRHDTARMIFRNPGRSSMTGIHYIEPLGIYILPQWYYTHLDDPKRRWKATCIELYQSPAPWGPWELFHAENFEPEGWYNPYIPNKFISEDGLRFWIFVAGDWTTGSGPEGFYCLHMIPVSLAETG